MNSNQFKIEQKINESATTIVYRAFDETLHRTVLLKVLHKHLANDTMLRERFIREARACAALQSEHIVQVYDLTEIDGAPAIVMEFVDGQSVKDIIATGSQNTFEFAKKVAVHVLRALSIAHEKGIIHRDIKPGNILVSKNGTIKVTDFGLAYVALSPTVTMEGMVLGTPAYMAPEQIRGDEIDERTDLFSLGVTLIEVLSGERIFEGSTYSECMKKVLSFKVDELQRFDVHSSPIFPGFLIKLLHPKKEERFISAHEALNILDEKKSSIFIRPIVASRKKYIPLVVGIFVCLLFIFGWMELRPKQELIPQDRIIIPAQTTSDSIVLSTNKSLNDEQQQTSTTKPIVQEITTNDAKEELVEIIDSGKVYITSNPWAKVYINNQLIGETPIAKPVILAAGNHSIMFSNPSFDPIIKTVTVQSNRDVSVVGNFIEQAGFLMCMITPWAEIYIDEQYKDTTPLTKPIMVSAGKHTVRFKNPAFTDIVKEIVIISKDTTHLIVDLTK